jgi:hypothetical protein
LLCSGREKVRGGGEEGGEEGGGEKWRGRMGGLGKRVGGGREGAGSIGKGGGNEGDEEGRVLRRKGGQGKRDGGSWAKRWEEAMRNRGGVCGDVSVALQRAAALSRAQHSGRKRWKMRKMEVVRRKARAAGGVRRGWRECTPASYCSV